MARVESAANFPHLPLISLLEHLEMQKMPLRLDPHPLGQYDISYQPLPYHVHSIRQCKQQQQPEI